MKHETRGTGRRELPDPYDVELRSFQPGLGTFAWVDDGFDPQGVPKQAPDTSTLKHYHTDMIGTTRMMTDSGGTEAR